VNVAITTPLYKQLTSWRTSSSGDSHAYGQSFDASSIISVNRHIIQEDLPPLSYGRCFSQVIHYVISLHLYHPKIHILVGDIKAAYRRNSLHGNTAVKCAIIFKESALPSLRFTFGCSPCLQEFCLFSKMCGDLTYDILHCDTWDPNTLGSPHSSKIKEPSPSDDHISFMAEKLLDVSVPIDGYGKIDIFIDNGIAVMTPDIGRYDSRALQELLLAIHTLCRPINPNDPIPREDCLSLGKGDEEGGLSECVTILGWTVNTRSLSITLPTKKFRRWDHDLSNILTRKKTSLS